jgi:hypothetical protein
MIGFIGTSLQLQLIITAHNQWLSKTHSIPYWTTSVFSSTMTDLVLIYDRSLLKRRLSYECRMSLSLTLSLTLWPTVSRSLWLGIKHPSGVSDQISITVRQLGVCWYGAISLTRERVCPIQLLLAFASAVILGSQSRRTRDHILLSQIRDFRFRRLLRLTRLRWRYSTPPPHGGYRMNNCLQLKSPWLN